MTVTPSLGSSHASSSLCDASTPHSRVYLKSAEESLYHLDRYLDISLLDYYLHEQILTHSICDQGVCTNKFNTSCRTGVYRRVQGKMDSTMQADENLNTISGIHHLSQVFTHNHNVINIPHLTHGYLVL